MSNRPNDIPPEILDVVFDLAGITDGSPTSRIALASVCKTWWDVIYSNPVYWTTLRCSVQSDAESADERLVQYMEQWFGRAGSLPLTLDLVTGYQTSGHVPTHLVASLVHNSRWKELRFNVPWGLGRINIRYVPWLWELFRCASNYSLASGIACWESLRALRIRALGSSIVEADTFHLRLAAPLLESFQMHILECRSVTWLQDLLNWKSLRHLELKGLFLWMDAHSAAGFYLGVLSRASHLKSIRVEDRGLQIPYTSPSSGTGTHLPIALDHLSSFQFPDSQFTRHMLTQLSLPALVSLGLSNLIIPYRPTLGSAITRLIQQSNCALRRLSIEDAAMMDEEILVILLLLPTLEHLILSCQSYPYFTTYGQSRRFLAGMAEENSNNPTFLPNLRTLSYRDHGREEHSYGEMIATFKQIAEDAKRSWDATTEQWDSTSGEWRKDQIRPHEDHACEHRCRLEKAELALQKWVRPVYSLVVNSP